MESIKKWSLLGLTLTVASAVTAAILPSKDKTQEAFATNGKCELVSGSIYTCTFTVASQAVCSTTANGASEDHAANTDGCPA